jgi:hypothetical protein
MSANRSAGRNARKKLVRKLQSEQCRFYSAKGEPKLKTEMGKPLLNSKQLLAQAQATFLDSCQKELDRRSVLLGRDGCWQFLTETRTEALKLGVERELREKVAIAAARFMGRSVKTLRTFSG